MEQRLENQQLNTRAYRRFPVDEDATLFLIDLALPQQCKIVNLSLEGCRLRSLTPFRASIHSRVEIVFKVNGIVFRLSGTVQWANEHEGIGIHFVYPTPRRRAELAELLGEVEEAVAAKAAREAAEKLAAEEKAASEQAAQELAAQEQATQQKASDQSKEKVEPRTTAPAGAQTARPRGIMAVLERLRLVPRPPELRPPAQEAAQPASERPPNEQRKQTRHEVDTSAAILLINVGSQLVGRILDLSQGGCRIRTEERFPVGIYTRVEVEFRFGGLPFRLGGVVQAIHDRRLVGIRFLDLSDRKKEQVKELIDEIERMRAAQPPNHED